MNNRYLHIVPLALIEIILQLTFFWLAPSSAPCYWLVYAFGTLLSLTHIGVVYFTGYVYGVRRGMPVIVAGSICQILIIAVCIILLANGSGTRDAVFALLIASALYVVIIMMQLLSARDEESEEMTIIMEENSPSRAQLPPDDRAAPPLPIRR